MPSFTVQRREAADIWNSDKGGQMQAWDLTLKHTESDATYDCQANTKFGNDFPGVGETVEGDVNSTARGWKFKKSYSQNGAKGNGGGDYRSPEQIMRGFAHSNALAYFQLKNASDPEFTIKSWEDYLKLVGLFYEDIKGAA